MAGSEPAAAKAALRQRIRRQRRELPDAERLRRGSLITDVALATIGSTLPGAARIACTWSMPTEPPTDDLIERLQHRGVDVRTPRIEPGWTMAWVRTPPGAAVTPGALTSGVLGIRTPVGDDTAPLSTCAVIVLPALAIDRRGLRLGQGGGYFDRALSDLASHAEGGPLRMAMLYADELIDELPSQDHDQPVDCAVSEGGVTWFATQGGSALG
ncbi:MAG: 5-formyltetrahydrofolate cyclo-ligase [Actinomycetales bacterium]|nr:5-formyltetrahydrofolate cyclo-ligase [Actinomycetales bacterium]